MVVRFSGFSFDDLPVACLLRADAPDAVLLLELLNITFHGCLRLPAKSRQVWYNPHEEFAKFCLKGYLLGQVDLINDPSNCHL